MTSFPPRQLRNIGEAALTGDVPSNAVQSVAAEGSVAFVEALQAEAQAQINAGRKVPSQPGRRPGWGEPLGVAP
jgi:hypothetical protein